VAKVIHNVAVDGDRSGSVARRGEGDGAVAEHGVVAARAAVGHADAAGVDDQFACDFKDVRLMRVADTDDIGIHSLQAAGPEIDRRRGELLERVAGRGVHKQVAEPIDGQGHRNGHTGQVAEVLGAEPLRLARHGRHPTRRADPRGSRSRAALLNHEHRMQLDAALGSPGLPVIKVEESYSTHTDQPAQ